MSESLKPEILALAQTVDDEDVEFALNSLRQRRDNPRQGDYIPDKEGLTLMDKIDIFLAMEEANLRHLLRLAIAENILRYSDLIVTLDLLTNLQKIREKLHNYELEEEMQKTLEEYNVLHGTMARD